MEFYDSFFKHIMDGFHEGVYCVDLTRTITYWNAGAEAIAGYSAEEVIGRKCADGLLNHIDEKGNVLCFSSCPLSEAMNSALPVSKHAFLRHKRGHRVAVSIRAIPMIIDGELIGVVEAFIPEADIHRSIIPNKELEKLALYDPLTGLPNRRFIDNYLSNQIRDFEDFNLQFAVIMLDLDPFKYVNDEYGHDVGDAVLKMASGTFKNALRSSDFIGRWGGEEFLAIVHCNDAADLRMIAEKIRALVEASELSRAGKNIKITISAGASIIKAGDTPETLTKRADDALYFCKRNGRNQSYIL